MVIPMRGSACPQADHDRYDRVHKVDRIRRIPIRSKQQWDWEPSLAKANWSALRYRPRYFQDTIGVDKAKESIIAPCRQIRRVRNNRAILQRPLMQQVSLLRLFHHRSRRGSHQLQGHVCEDLSYSEAIS